MLKAVAGDSGNQILIIGLSFDNLNRMRYKPNDDFIPVYREETGIGFDVMIYATGEIRRQTRATETRHGHRVLLIGLSTGDVNALLENPGKTILRMEGQSVEGEKVSIMIFSGETEIGLAEQVVEFIGPKTAVNVDRRLKN